MCGIFAVINLNQQTVTTEKKLLLQLTGLMEHRGPDSIGVYTDEQVGDISNDQIEYSDEDPWIREKFEGELVQRNRKSSMPDEAYKERDYQWDYRSAADQAS